MCNPDKDKFKTLQNRAAWVLSEIDDTIPVIAQKLGVNKNTISAYKKGKGDLKGVVIENLVKAYKILPEWILTGNGPIYKDTISDKQQDSSDEIPSSENITKVVIEHQGMIKRFKKPERAKAINEDLIEIEEISDELLDSIASHIKSSLNAAKIVKEASKKTQKTDKNDLQGRSSA